MACNGHVQTYYSTPSGIGDLSRFRLSGLGLLDFITLTTLNYLAFQSFDFEHT